VTLKTLGIQIAALATVTVLWCLWFATPVAAEVIISELLPDPAATSDKSEWVELYNTGNEAIDLSNWKLDTLSLSGNIPALGYLIIAKNTLEFEKEFGTVTNLLEINISLTNTSDTVTLTRSDLSVDTLSYTSTVSNVSYERGGPLCSDKWRWHPSSNTVGKVNDYQVAECQLPAAEESAELFVSLDSTTWVKSIEVIGTREVFLKCVSDEDICGGGVWKLNGIEIGSSAVLKPGEYLFSYFKDKEYLGGKIMIYPKVAITEVMPDPEGSDTGKEYLEIQNLEEESVDLLGLKIVLSGGSEIILPTSALPSKAFYLHTFTTSTLPNCGGTTCPFGITLLWNELVADTMTYTKAVSGRSWSLNNENEWTLDYPSSPGKKNAPDLVSFEVMITEVYSAPDSKLGEEEWVEVYNYGEKEVDLSLLVLKFEDHSYMLPNIVLASCKHYVLNDISFSLVNTGGTISVYNGESEIDSFTYPKSKAGVSSIREWVEDNYTANIVETHTPTPGWRNYLGLEGESTNASDKKAETTEVDNAGQVLAMDTAYHQIYEMPKLTAKSIGVKKTDESVILLWPFTLVAMYVLVVWMIADLYIAKDPGRFVFSRIKSRLSRAWVSRLSKRPELW